MDLGETTLTSKRNISCDLDDFLKLYKIMTNYLKFHYFYIYDQYRIKTNSAKNKLVFIVLKNINEKK